MTESLILYNVYILHLTSHVVYKYYYIPPEGEGEDEINQFDGNKWRTGDNN